MLTVLDINFLFMSISYNQHVKVNKRVEWNEEKNIKTKGPFLNLIKSF